MRLSFMFGISMAFYITDTTPYLVSFTCRLWHLWLDILQFLSRCQSVGI